MECTMTCVQWENLWLSHWVSVPIVMVHYTSAVCLGSNVSFFADSVKMFSPHSLLGTLWQLYIHHISQSYPSAGKKTCWRKCLVTVKVNHINCASKIWALAQKCYLARGFLNRHIGIQVKPDLPEISPFKVTVWRNFRPRFFVKLLLLVPLEV